MTRRLHDSGFTLTLPRTITPIEPKIARAREQLPAVMQHVRLGNVRHRLMLDRNMVLNQRWDVTDRGIAFGRTACNITIAGKPYAVIDAGYLAVFPTGERVEPCTLGCFTLTELDYAKELQLEEDERIAAKAAAAEADRIEMNQRAQFEREQGRRRVEEYKKTGQHPPLKKPHDDD